MGNWLWRKRQFVEESEGLDNWKPQSTLDCVCVHMRMRHVHVCVGDEC